MIELGLISGAILAILFEYVPGLNTWYKNQDSQTKRLVMLVMLCVTAVGTMGLSCLKTPWVYIECSQGGFLDILQLVIVAAAGNQSTYALTKKAKHDIEPA